MGVVKEILCWVMGVAYVGAGVSHFTNPLFFLEIVPPHLPAKLAIVYVSGVAEILLGIAVIVRQTRPWAAWGIIALLIAVFPANIYQAVYQIRPEHAPEAFKNAAPMQFWLRLPVQFLLALWAWWYTRPSSAR